ncbi:MAG: hypothetical protein KDD43_06860 [Bdellovibrionales bacterium]|nr:hypothetical protein [Bdellovibrionales bacterium]
MPVKSDALPRGRYTEVTEGLMLLERLILWGKPDAGDPMGKAEALRQAPLDVRQANSQQQNGDSRPADWAGWVLSGEWE